MNRQVDCELYWYNLLKGLDMLQQNHARYYDIPFPIGVAFEEKKRIKLLEYFSRIFRQNSSILEHIVNLESSLRDFVFCEAESNRESSSIYLKRLILDFQQYIE